MSHNTFTFTRARQCPAPVPGVARLAPNEAVYGIGVADACAHRSDLHADFVTRHEDIIASTNEHDRRIAALTLLIDAANRDLRVLLADTCPALHTEDPLIKHAVASWKAFIRNAEIHFAAYDAQMGRAEESAFIARISDANGRHPPLPFVPTNIPASQSAMETISSQGIWFSGPRVSVPLRNTGSSTMIARDGSFSSSVARSVPFRYTHYIAQLRQELQEETLSTLQWLNFSRDNERTDAVAYCGAESGDSAEFDEAPILFLPMSDSSGSSEQEEELSPQFTDDVEEDEEDCVSELEELNVFERSEEHQPEDQEQQQQLNQPHEQQEQQQQEVEANESVVASPISIQVDEVEVDVSSEFPFFQLEDDEYDTTIEQMATSPHQQHQESRPAQQQQSYPTITAAALSTLQEEVQQQLQLQGDDQLQQGQQLQQQQSGQPQQLLQWDELDSTLPDAVLLCLASCQQGIEDILQQHHQDSDSVSFLSEAASRPLTADSEWTDVSSTLSADFTADGMSFHVVVNPSEGSVVCQFGFDDSLLELAA